MKVSLKSRPIRLNETLLAFGTPVYIKLHEDAGEMNEGLKQFVLDDRRKHPGEVASNQGGWHSSRDLLRRLGNPHAPRLEQMFLEGIRAALSTIADGAEFNGQAAIDAWANVNERGDWNHGHIHPHSPWSGVYYVATDVGQGAGGELRFTDPRTAALMLNHPLNPFHATNNVRLRPQPGMMVVFPSFLYHAVDVYHGAEPRISIAMNLR